MSIWRHSATPEQLQEHSRGTMVEHLGIRVLEVGPDYLRASMPVDCRTHQNMGMTSGADSSVYRA